MKNILLIIILFINILLYSATYIVKQDGTGDYSQIQSAVDNANPGDTIRVYPGTYYENIEIFKDLSLVSNYEYTNDENYIHNTILDGNHTGSVIRCAGTYNNTKSFYICGFTIKNGSGYYSYGSTIGGGICARYSNIVLKKNIIKNNVATYGGGAILNSFTTAELYGNSIYHNQAYVGGGGLNISYHSTAMFDSNLLNSVYMNYAGHSNDISYGSNTNEVVHIILDTLTVAQPEYFYVTVYNSESLMDTTLLNLSVQHSCLDHVSHDLYVSPNGDNNNSGLSFEEPLQDIHYAMSKIIADSLHPHTIYLDNGIYSPSLNGQHFPIHLKPYVSIIGRNEDNTILDAEQGGGLFYSRDFNNTDFYHYLIKHITIKNMKLVNAYYSPALFTLIVDDLTLENIEVHDCNSDISTLHLLWSKVSMKNLYLHDNLSEDVIHMQDCYHILLQNSVISNNSYPNQWGNLPICTAAVFLNDMNLPFPPDTNIINCLITKNATHFVYDPNYFTFSENALSIGTNSRVNLINTTITDNIARSDSVTAIELYERSELSVYNSIIYNPGQREFFLDGRNNGSNYLMVTNSLVKGGFWGMFVLDQNNVDWNFETNLDTIPMFTSSSLTNPYGLSSLSPCIDAGTLDLPEGVELPETDLAGNPRVVGSNIDMGAYEYQGDESQDDELQVPEINTTLISVYPNPFRISGTKSEITIKLELSKAGNIKLEVYNLKGQKVANIINAFASQGTYNSKWDCKDENGKKISSGMYLVKLTENGKVTRISRFTVVK